MTDEENRREDRGSPPTVIAQSYQAMGPEGRSRLRKIGGLMLAFGIGMPMVGELFLVLSWVYWIFAGFVAMAGLCLVWPELGIYVLDVVPKALIKIAPNTREILRPNRRDDRDGDA